MRVCVCVFIFLWQDYAAAAPCTPTMPDADAPCSSTLPADAPCSSTLPAKTEGEPRMDFNFAAKPRVVMRVSSDESSFWDDDNLFTVGPPPMTEAEARVAAIHNETVATYRECLFWGCMHTLHSSMPTNNAILWLAHMRSAVEKLRRDELDIGCGDGSTGSGIQQNLLAASFAFFAEKFNITKTTVTYMVAAEADEKKAKFVVWQHEPACLLTDVAQLSSNRWHNWANGGVLRSSLSALLHGRCRCVVLF